MKTCYDISPAHSLSYSYQTLYSVLLKKAQPAANSFSFIVCVFFLMSVYFPVNIAQVRILSMTCQKSALHQVAFCREGDAH